MRYSRGTIEAELLMKKTTIRMNYFVDFDKNQKSTIRYHTCYSICLFLQVIKVKLLRVELENFHKDSLKPDTKCYIIVLLRKKMKF